MQILIQKDYQSLLTNQGRGYQYQSDLNYLASADVVIGDEGFLAQIPAVITKPYFILLTSEASIDLAFLSNFKNRTPYQVCQKTNQVYLEDTLDEIYREYNRKNQIQLVKTEIQRKRKELENLNEKLNRESEQQILSLEQSHSEETQKNLKEKSLLHFLDFIQSESVHEDFFGQLLKFIWKDLKKLGRFYQLGFSLKTTSEKSNVFTYDGQTENRGLLAADFKSGSVSTQLASAWGRPVGKIMTWVLPGFSRDASVFVEVVDQQLSSTIVESYFKDRLSVLSLYLDRWMIEKEYEVIVERWNRTFKSFSGYMHVVDENFNVFQSNYAAKTGIPCYKELANRDSPCPECPILQNKNTEFFLKDGQKVKTYYSEFKYNSKKYYFVIYEDVTQLHLLQGQMIHSEKMSALGRLGNHLAHELNNPLTGIKSYVQSLLQNTVEANLSATLQSDLNEILKATLRCQRIIKNFIEFSHQAEAKLEPVKFAEVLQNTLTLLKTVLRSHRLFIDVKETSVLANAHDLQQVLFNLIKNSCQAMEQPGAVTIFEEEKNGKIYFYIKDSGPGFSENILKNMFQPFMTTKKLGEGTGLGLYLSKKMMNNMQADLELTTSAQGAKISLIFDKL
ncbi:MAG: hypothetical protein H7328_13470 [Bdellovibrio sp.]|nr:hypothetical protein [Bdellovibrio sp.]